jgi:hypothetical protein
MSNPAAQCGAYTTHQLDEDVEAVVKLLHAGRYQEIDGSDTVDLAEAILRGDPHVIQAFCATVTGRMYPLWMKPSDHLIPVALGIRPGMTVLVLSYQSGGPRPCRATGTNQYFNVTDEGLRYAGEYTYSDSRLMASTAAG